MAHKFDFSKVIVWNEWKTAEEQFFQLVESPPLHSIVVEVHPKVAQRILAMTNTRNRPLRESRARDLGENVVATGNFELTGDTVKFDTDGALLDGQHRLTACAQSPSGLITHMVFGLPPKIFDVLDQGSKRTAADALALEGFGNSFILAGALNFVKKYETGSKITEGGGSGKALGISPREAISLLNGDYADIAKWTKYAERIQKTFKYPPSLICGILYLASRQASEKRVREFAEAWLAGDRGGVNKNFDELARRLHAIRSSNNGHVSRGMLAALMVITWNYWNAGLPLTARALSWSRSSKFPTFEGDPKTAARKARAFEAQDSSLNASCLRLVQSLRRYSDSHGVCAKAADKLAESADVPKTQVRYLLGQLIRDGFITLVHPGGRGPGDPSRYAITPKGFSALAKAPLPEKIDAAE